MKLITIFVLAPALINAASFHRFKFSRCRKDGVKCISKNTFILCSKFSKFVTPQFDELECPPGYKCQEQNRQPCIQDPDYVNNNNGCGKFSTTVEPSETTTSTQKKLQVTENLNLESSTNTKEIFKTPASISTESQEDDNTTSDDSDSDDSDSDDSDNSDDSNATVDDLIETTNHVKLSIENESTDKTTVRSISATAEENEFEITASKTEEMFNTVTEPFKTTSEVISSTTKSEGNTFITRLNPKNNPSASTFSDSGTSSDDSDISANTNDITPIQDETSTSPNSGGRKVKTENAMVSSSWGTSTSILLDPPRCSSLGVFSAPTCNQYYECEPYWMFWYIPVLKTCSEGHSFSTAKSHCVPTAESDCID